MVVGVPANDLHEEYLKGMDNIEKNVQGIRDEVLELQSNYKAFVTENGAAVAEKTLLSCMIFLRENNLAIDAVDSEARLLSLLNDLHATSADEKLTQFVSSYRESFPSVMAALQSVARKFDEQVRQKLSFLSSPYQRSVNRCTDSLAVDYTRHVDGILGDMNRQFDRLQLLLGSYERYGINPELLDAVLQSSALRLVHLPRDAANKVWQLLVKAEMCVAKDKQFVSDINICIQSRREEAQERERTLKKEKQLQMQLVKQFTLANMMLQKNKQRLKKVELELAQIEAQIQTYEEKKKAGYREKQHKESAVEFLKIGITQTRKNYSLQLKKARVMKQLKELDEALTSVEFDLVALYQQIGEKTAQKRELTAEVLNGETSYNNIRGDLERLTRSIATLEPQVHELTEQLFQFEALRLVKTCPEVLDNFLDRPTSVKLAPSLQETIERKRKRML